MSQVLYRKYRPKDFSELIGQDQIVKVLRSTIEAGKPAHAYLFTGPRGTGKTSTARIFAREVNGIPVEDKLDQYVDIIEIDAASNRGINEIRELKEKIAFAPAQLSYKIYIIDEVHMLTKEAFNAILKTLEEPPAQSIFIMATTEVHKLPATILSRVVRFDFRLASNDQLFGKLEKTAKNENVTLEKQALEKLVKLAKGSFRDAESLLEKVINVAGEEKKGKLTATDVYEVLGVSNEEEIQKLLDMFLSGDFAGLQSKLEEIFSLGLNPQQLLHDMAEYLLMVVSASSSDQKKYSGSEMRVIYKLLAEIQQLITNYQQYLDPYMMIKLSFVNLINSLFGENPSPTLQVRDVIAQKEHNNSVSTPVLKNDTVQSKPVVKSQIQKMASTTVEGEVVSGDFASQIILKIKSEDIRLGTILGQGQIKKTEKGYVVSVPYKFHLEQLQKTKNKQLIISKFEEVLGAGVNVDFEQEKGVAASKVQSSTSPSDLAQSQSNNSSNKELVEEIFGDIIE